MKKNLLLLFGSLVLSFAIAEIICRIKGNYLSYNERTGAGGYTSPFDTDNRGWTHAYDPYEKRVLQRDEFLDTWTANDAGLKEKNIAPQKTKQRLFILGDSFTEGVGAPPDSSYPRILETLLDSTEVINAGIGGSDVFFEYQLLLALYPKYKPDAVIVTCNPSDAIEYLTRGGFERFVNKNELQYRKAPWFEPLYAHSLLVRLIVHDVFHYDFNFIKQKDFNSEMTAANTAMCGTIDSFQTFCSVNHIHFGMMFHPFYTDLLHPENYQQKTLLAYCQQKNILCIDELDDLFAKGITAQNWQTIYWPSDGHFKPEGYEFLARCVFEFIEKQNWNLFGLSKSSNHKIENP